eukprot:scaffold120907_cov60-Phaeocystis_antarctica.AAC.1
MQPIVVQVAKPNHRFCLAALGLHPKGRHFRLLLHRLLPRIRLGAADGATLHKALERVAHLHGREKPLAHRLIGHGRFDLRLRLPREPLLDGAPLVAPAILRYHRVDRKLGGDRTHVLLRHLVDGLPVALDDRL